MDNLHKLVFIGGLFSIFSFIHFVSDWLLQTHAEAMSKHNNWKIRAKHCIIYASGFLPIFYVLNFSLIEYFISYNVLFWSHFYLDTYHATYLWMKWVRRPPQMINPRKIEIGSCKESPEFKVLPPDPKEGFIEFVQTPLGKILMITVDQIFHLMCLFPVVWIALRNLL